MIQGSAAARLGRALNTRTTQAAPSYQLRVGCEVDFYREPSAKDSSGWSGPAEVVDISQQHRNIVSVKWHGKVLNVTLSRIRHSLHFLIFLQSFAPNTPQRNSWSHLRETVNDMPPDTHVTLGRILQNGSWVICVGNSKYPKLMSAIKFAEFDQASHEYLEACRSLSPSGGSKSFAVVYSAQRTAGRSRNVANA